MNGTRLETVPETQVLGAMNYGPVVGEHLVFKFNKRAEYFVGVRDESLSVVAVRVNNPNGSPLGYDGPFTLSVWAIATNFSGQKVETGVVNFTSP